MTSKELIDQCLPYVRHELHSELETIINSADDEDLKHIKEVFTRVYDGNEVGHEKRGRAICVAIDFLTSRLKYFKKLPPKFETKFGIEIELIPDTIAEWRDEKLRGIID